MKNLKLLRRDEVLEILGMSNAWLYGQIRKGKFPQPIQVGARAIAWRQSDVEEWLESRQTGIKTVDAELLEKRMIGAELSAKRGKGPGRPRKPRLQRRSRKQASITL